MSLLSILAAINYCLVLTYGLLLATDISGGWQNKRQKRFIIALCPILLMVQLPIYLLAGADAVRRLYPLITHLPLALALIFILKRKFGITVVSVCTAYLCCQLPRWVQLMTTAVSHSDLVGEIAYTVAILPIFFLLRRYFVRSAHSAMTHSRHSLILFGSLPVAYYLFDYLTAVYSDALYTNIRILNEFLPTALILFYVVFLTAYHVQEQQHMQAKLQGSMLEQELEQSRSEIEILRQAETQSAIYQHDMRHHLAMLESLLATNNTEQASDYIKKVHADMDAILPRRYCENELINLLCSSFAGRAEREGIAFRVKAKLPKALPISDTELCAVISNGLENALAGTADIDPKWVEFYCEVKLNKLLIEIKNPCAGDIPMEDGLPISQKANHGYGCRSIRTIAEHHRGLCSFDAEGGVFTLRVVLPV